MRNKDNREELVNEEGNLVNSLLGLISQLNIQQTDPSLIIIYLSLINLLTIVSLIGSETIPPVYSKGVKGSADEGGDFSSALLSLLPLLTGKTEGMPDLSLLSNLLGKKSGQKINPALLGLLMNLLTGETSEENQDEGKENDKEGDKGKS
ncbi:hypothetical protein [Calderihabitans maritimus]|uniref:Uncharacterized protein n=1 Tax=Calderihabitans maritimus TaxID=1246530 RepID=A0A1Z5HMW5_9FIRM|nr:hypothetical protein [Calderihabitans maritimus]GAW90854.1 hypothetical protein KKC1_00160 [Calderihabitans maritimus]